MSRTTTDQRLLPSVLDRLLDEEPSALRESEKSRSQLLREMKLSVRRDLENLLNTRVSLYPVPNDLGELQKSVLNYGIPDFSGLSMGSRRQRARLAVLVEEAIRRFETRFKSVHVELVEESGLNDRTIRFRIEGLLHAEPAPEPVTFDSKLQPQLGEFDVKAGSA